MSTPTESRRLARRRAIAAALEAHELTWREIAAEFGCSTATVMLVAHDLRLNSGRGLDTEISADTNATTEGD